MRWTPSSEVPGTILPVQFYDRAGAADTPEKRLMFAILLDAVLQLQRGDEDVAVDAERWIREEIGEVPVSFSQACEVLGLEPQPLARALLSWGAGTGAGLAMPARPMHSSKRRITPLGRMRRRGVRGPKELATAS